MQNQYDQMTDIVDYTEKKIKRKKDESKFEDVAKMRE